MSRFKTFIALLKTPGKMIAPLANMGIFNWMPDRLYLKMVYHGEIGKKLDLNNPVTFNEKLQWLKLYDHKPIYRIMVDKYEVKQYVAEKIGNEYLIPTIGVWDSVENIPFDAMPDQYVIKCTHDSGSVVVCKDKNQFNVEKAKEKLKRKMNRNPYWIGREWPYRDLRPRIIAEEYLEDSNIGELRDYKFFCFNGRVRCFKVDYDRFIYHRAHYYSPDGRIIKIAESAYPPDYSREIILPNSIGKMISLAEELSKNTSFLRVDFYDVNGRIYFGELTFYPASGLGSFIYKGNDEMLGAWLKLPSYTQDKVSVGK